MVDDEPEACEAVRHVLEQHGAAVHTAGSASEALQIIPQIKPQVLVADIAMPGMDGYELIRTVRRLPSGGTLRAVALTAYMESAREMALQAGFQLYRLKPVAPTELVRLVERLAKESMH